MDANAAAIVRLGWLWFDNDPKTSLEDKVERAASRYREKFGRRPRLCYVRESALAAEQTYGHLRVVGARNVLPGHFLFVVEAAEAAQPPA